MPDNYMSIKRKHGTKVNAYPNKICNTATYKWQFNKVCNMLYYRLHLDEAKADCEFKELKLSKSLEWELSWKLALRM